MDHFLFRAFYRACLAYHRVREKFAYWNRLARGDARREFAEPFQRRAEDEAAADHIASGRPLDPRNARFEARGRALLASGYVPRCRR